MPNPSMTAPGVQPAATDLIPATPHQAYCVGHDAAVRGDDLHSVVFAALRTWPLDLGLGELAELIASAAFGYWHKGGRA
ncbi:MAG: hypothetical protein ACYC61_14110 [Isosphaeraceae bacterium]